MHARHSSPTRPSRRLARLFVVALALCAAVVALSGEASACPMCKAALANSDDGDRLVQGFFWSILFMLLMPFALLGSFSAYMYVLVRRARSAGGVGELAALDPGAMDPSVAAESGPDGVAGSAAPSASSTDAG